MWIQVCDDECRKRAGHVSTEEVTMMRIFTLALAMSVAGCATRDYVQEQVSPVSGRVQSVEGRLSSAEAAIKSGDAAHQANGKAIAEFQVPLRLQADRIARTEAEVTRLSKTAQEAVERANQAGQLAQGKMVYEVVLTDDKFHFASHRAVLDKAAQTSLNDLAARFKAENKGLYIEIQGHTDSIGSSAANMKLGERRAETVYRHLHMQGGIPLHRMNVISYGESKPIASNKTRAGRKQNRRVVLVVIQ